MTTTSMREKRRILVTGATGYIGGRLVPHLLELGYPVRVLVRDPARLEGRPWLSQVEVVQGDVLEPAGLAAGLKEVWAAYYLIHSMSGHADFHERDLEAAHNFGRAAQSAGLKRIIYLGGLGNPDADLSRHLRSRQQTGAALRESGVSVTEFRAGPIVGSGSLSFEMLRYLTERLPVMICPRWVYSRVQPIAIRDTLAYLTGALTTPASAGEIVEIGGADVLTYRDMMLGYARERGLRRAILPVPVLTPRLSSYWVHLVTPIPSDIARPLVEGLGHDLIVRDEQARTLFPSIRPLDYASAVRLALSRLRSADVITTWSDSVASSMRTEAPVILTTHEGMIIERRQQMLTADPEHTFQVYTGIGGQRGWPTMNYLWRLRGVLDRLVGGVGFRRGRRHPDRLRTGDALDFWRVEALQPNRLLRLRAEMKLPGRAWLQFEVEPVDEERSRLVQTAFFAPTGLFGFLYWYGLYPLHALIFSGMIRRLARQAETHQAADSAQPAVATET